MPILPPPGSMHLGKNLWFPGSGSLLSKNILTPNIPSGMLEHAQALKPGLELPDSINLLNRLGGKSVANATSSVWSTPLYSGVVDPIGQLVAFSAGANALYRAAPKVEKGILKVLSNNPVGRWIDKRGPVKRLARSLEKQTYVNVQDSSKFLKKIRDSYVRPQGTIPSNIIAGSIKGGILLGVPVPIIPGPMVMQAYQQAKTLGKRTLGLGTKNLKNLKTVYEARSIPLGETASEHILRRRAMVNHFNDVAKLMQKDRDMSKKVGLKKLHYFYNKGANPVPNTNDIYKGIIKSIEFQDLPIAKLRKYTDNMSQSYKRGFISPEYHPIKKNLDEDSLA